MKSSIMINNSRICLFVIHRLLGLYQCLHHRLHAPNLPLKLIFQQLDKETMLAWVSYNIHIKRY